jgi:hypothetical protein
MISFTGSTRAGILVAKNAADTVKRVHQELGGKCPDIILEGTPLDAPLRAVASAILINSGQSCHAPTASQAGSVCRRECPRDISYAQLCSAASLTTWSSPAKKSLARYWS